MTNRGSGVRCATALVLAGLLIGSASLAQGPGGGAGGARRGGQGGMRMGGGMRGFNMEPTASNLRTEVLERALKLSASQKTKIDAIKTESRNAMRALMPQRGQGAPGAPGAPAQRPDPAQMQQMMAKFQAQQKADNAKIEAVLNADQKKTLIKILAEYKDYRMVGFPADATTALKLTSAQHQKIVAIAANVRKSLPQPGAAGGGTANFQALRQTFQAARDQAQAVLTADQKATLQKLTPQQGGGFGGAGGRGGGAGGRRGAGAGAGRPGG